MANKRPSRRHTNSLTSRSLAARERALRALSSIRHGSSLSQAARENGVTVRTVQRYVGRALVQDRRGGRIRAAKSDRLVRYLQIPGQNGPMEIKVRGSKTASEVAKYKAAVNRFLRGDRNALADWHGKKIAGIELITAENTLKNLAVKDLLPYSLYRSVTGGAV
jgi:molybdenum-dependent DNA-binding transcriptional regulator ModE